MLLMDSIPFCRTEAVRQIPVLPHAVPSQRCKKEQHRGQLCRLSIQHRAGRWLGWFLQRRAPRWDLQHPSRDPSGVSL